jgi:adenosylmethionine-8-amino-7-oxononanoate aminotransferase
VSGSAQLNKPLQLYSVTAGISVGGISANRKAFSGNMLPNVDHMPATYSHKDMAYSKGLPTWGAHLADELEKIVALHDASNIAAVVSDWLRAAFIECLHPCS